METGEKIKSIRVALGLTQVDFARPLGVGGNYISELEKGKGLGSSTLLTLLRMYYHINETWWDSDGREGAMFLWDPKAGKSQPVSLREVAREYGINPELADLLLSSIGKLPAGKQCTAIKDIINGVIDLLDAEEQGRKSED
ncbi:MAG TPA: helix-turn-helix domain-containing protein [Geobacteraceae bacterium]|nr:helix-turn-helix domain-containing protein [Geobacteraceae bacterium]